jgi:hypothetical protein
MYLQSARYELRNPPPIRWRWLSAESAVIVAVTAVLFSLF